MYIYIYICIILFCLSPASSGGRRVGGRSRGRAAGVSQCRSAGQAVSAVTSTAMMAPPALLQKRSDENHI